MGILRFIYFGVKFYNIVNNLYLKVLSLRFRVLDLYFLYIMFLS